MITFRSLFLVSSIVIISAQNYLDTCDNNDGCTFDEQAECGKLKHCERGSCDCKEGWSYHYIDNKCYQDGLKVGDTYVTNAQCSLDYMTTSASGKTCVCEAGYQGSTGDKNCDWGDLKALGEVVSYVTQCKAYKYSYEEKQKGHTPYSISLGVTLDVTNRCACASDWKADGDKCVPSLKEKGETCTLGTECNRYDYPYITCTGGTCACAPGKKFFEAWLIYNKYENVCFDTNALVDIKGGEKCGASLSGVTDFTCAKGLDCLQCPGSTDWTCVQRASFASLSAVLLCACLTVLAAVNHH